MLFANTTERKGGKFDMIDSSKEMIEKIKTAVSSLEKQNKNFAKASQDESFQPIPEGGSENESESSEDEEYSESIIETGSVTPEGGKHIIHCLTVIGQVEGHYILPAQNKTTKYEHVIPQLVAIEQDPKIEGLLLILNTVGGDVEAGLAIAELIAGMEKPTVSLVLGGGHSIGVPLAVSAKKSFIAPSATMTIHPVRMSGLVLGVPQTFSYFDKMQQRIIKFVTDNSSISSDRFNTLMMKTGELAMDVGTMIDGEEAVKEGLIDELGSLRSAIESLYDMIEQSGEKEALNGEDKNILQTDDKKNSGAVKGKTLGNKKQTAKPRNTANKNLDSNAGKSKEKGGN